MVKSGVYQIILREDGRSYIGSAVDIKTRWRNHISASKSLRTKQVIARAIAKHGKENFDWKILELCEIDQLLNRGQHWLDTVRPFADEHNGFNVRKVADSNLGITRSIESRLKQSKTMTGVQKTEGHKRKMSENWHKSRSAEYFDECSKRMTGDNNPAKRADVRSKISKSMTGKTWKDDTVRLKTHIEQRTGSKRTDEQKSVMSKAQQRVKTRSDSAKEKFYLIQRKLYEVTTPTGDQFQMYSRELKSYCVDHQINYSNLITTAKTGKLYKGGWLARLIE